MTDDDKLLREQFAAERQQTGPEGMVRFASAGNPAAELLISAESWERMGSPDDLWVSFKPDPDDGPRLHLYWVEFEAPPQIEQPPTGGFILSEGSAWERWLWRGCGVTAFDEEDAMSLIRDLAHGLPLPKVVSMTADVVVTDLPEYAQHGGVVAWRGIWYPPLNLGGPTE